MKIATKCIFCGGSERNSSDLKVCSRCVAKFAGSKEAIDRFAAGRVLTQEQARFLGVKWVKK
jgi:hypothetical protein